MIRRSARGCREDGFTLVELVVATTISAIVIAGVVTFTVTGFRTTEAVTTAMSETEELSLIRLVLTDDVRSASPNAGVTCADDVGSACPNAATTKGTTLTLGVRDQVNGFRTVQYRYLSTGELTRRVIPYSTATALPSPAPQTIARRLAPNFASAVFSVDIPNAVVMAEIALPGRTPAEATRVFEIKTYMRPQP